MSFQIPHLSTCQCSAANYFLKRGRWAEIVTHGTTQLATGKLLPTLLLERLSINAWEQTHCNSPILSNLSMQPCEGLFR